MNIDVLSLFLFPVFVFRSFSTCLVTNIRLRSRIEIFINRLRHDDFIRSYDRLADWIFQHWWFHVFNLLFPISCYCVTLSSHLIDRLVRLLKLWFEMRLPIVYFYYVFYTIIINCYYYFKCPFFFSSFYSAFFFFCFLYSCGNAVLRERIKKSVFLVFYRFFTRN